MRLFFRYLCLAALLAVPLVARPAEAGENKHLGTIVVSGASLTNVTTAVPFVIPLNAKITINCTAAAQMLTDSLVVTTATAGTKGLPVPALTNFPSSVTLTISSVSGRATAVIAIIGTASCDVWQRTGGE